MTQQVIDALTEVAVIRRKRTRSDAVRPRQLTARTGGADFRTATAVRVGAHQSLAGGNRRRGEETKAASRRSESSRTTTVIADQFQRTASNRR
jgi:hypothetical protein